MSNEFSFHRHNTRLQQSLKKNIEVILVDNLNYSVTYSIKSLLYLNNALPYYSSKNNYTESSTVRYQPNTGHYSITGSILSVYKSLINNNFSNFLRSIYSYYITNLKTCNKPLTEAQFTQNVTEKYADSLCYDKICPIERTKIVVGDHIAITPCNHVFKYGSLKKYLINYSDKCPMCRYSLI